MNKFLLLFVLLIAGVITARLALHAGKKPAEDPIEKKFTKAISKLDKSSFKNDDSKARILFLKDKTEVPVELILRFHDSVSKKAAAIFMSWEGEFATGSALGTDKKRHIVNSFLEGYAPFDTDNLWIPLYTLSKKKEYQIDQLQYNGMEDIWQTSREAFYYPRGDCEDHAIALADWLISLHQDARVVIGKYKTEGHAWVVLFKEGKTFILEATDKSGFSALKKYPLSATMLDYRPEFMFNRTEFWTNTGSVYTTDYKSSRWIKESRFINRPEK